ncbi:MAG: metallophosphoesterase [Chitinophagaceae bacterium]
MNRKKFLKQTSLLAAAAVTTSFTETSPAASGKPKRSLKVAFLTDVHVLPTNIAEEGMRKAYRHANALQKKPDFIINGGDSIMDAFAADKAKTQAQWDVWNKVMSEENKLPIYHVIGNHDVWGWQVKDEAVKLDSLYGKNWVLQQHKMPGRYYSFKKNNWHFIVLDSTQENDGGYIAKLDEPQFAWLENELKNVVAGDFVCIVSHIPIVSFCSTMFLEKNEPNGDFKIIKALLHTDIRRIKALFRQYPAIKVCLSGHVHLQDEVNYLGIKYFCNGAVSGRWWKGPWQEFASAYALFDFHDDGTVARQMISY